MKRHSLSGILILSMLCACEPKAPEKPAQPPSPTAVSPSQAAADTAHDERPTLSSRIDAGGRSATYRAYFEGTQLTDIEETGTADRAVSEYRYHGARLLKYTHTASQAAPTLLELDEQGRVQRAVAGNRTLGAEEIAAIRTRAQLLRSHALTQQATRAHLR